MESEFAVNLAGYIAMVAVAPFYVAAGFSLYLNQRTQLEGWDIEITFKRLVEHRQRKKRRTSQSMALTGILCCLLLLPSQPLEATPTDKATAKPESTEQIKVREQAKEIISEAPFTRFETKTYPEFYLDYTPEPDTDDDKGETTQLQWLASLLGFLADSIQWLIAALIAGLIIMLVIRYRHVLRALTTGEGKQNATQSKPNALFDLDISADSIPEDPAAAATALLQQGKTREAMSILYRSALYVLIHNQHLEIDDSFTEGQCLAQVRQNTSTATAEYFARLTGHWQRLAYAGLLLKEDELSQLVDDFTPVFKESGNV
jgi:hypothetical protein